MAPAPFLSLKAPQQVGHDSHLTDGETEARRSYRTRKGLHWAPSQVRLQTWALPTSLFLDGPWRGRVMGLGSLSALC